MQQLNRKEYVELLCIDVIFNLFRKPNKFHEVNSNENIQALENSLSHSVIGLFNL